MLIIKRLEVLYMSGYHGYSMSNNAMSAYNDGEKPISKWTKSDIISTIENAAKSGDLNLKCDLNVLKKCPSKSLKEMCLSRTSWHHTSSYYNRTNFYSIDFEKIKSLTNEQLSIEPVEPEHTDEIWKCAFLEWSGTRKHPKATEFIEIGTVKGDWFIRADGSKKKNYL
jgi:hypothetical protein